MKKVLPPDVQLPDPPKGTPCAWVPVTNAIGMPPVSGQTEVRVSPVTTPPG